MKPFILMRKEKESMVIGREGEKGKKKKKGSTK